MRRFFHAIRSPKRSISSRRCRKAGDKPNKRFIFPDQMSFRVRGLPIVEDGAGFMQLRGSVFCHDCENLVCAWLPGEP